MSEELVKFEHVWEDTRERKKDKWGKGYVGNKKGKGQAGKRTSVGKGQAGKRTSWEEEKWWKCCAIIQGLHPLETHSST